MTRSLRSLLPFWGIFLLLPDLIARIPTLIAGDARMRAFYVVGALGSLATLLVATALVQRLHARSRRAGIAAAAILAVWLGVATVCCAGYRLQYSDDFPPSDLSFALRNPSYAWAVFRAGTGLSERIALVLVPLIFAGILVRIVCRPRAAPRRLHVAVAAALAAASIGWTTSRNQEPVPADLHALRVVTLTTMELASPEVRLPVPHRDVPTPTPARMRPDVIILLGESLSAREWAPWNVASEASPRMAAFFREHAATSAFYPDAKSASGTTNVSVPTILTGLPPDATASDFARAPLVWQQARALGYRTALFSPQDFEWAHMAEFFLGADAPDVYSVAGSFAEARVNDGAVDDALAVDAAEKFIDGADATTPLFLVLQFGSTHFPCWAPGLPPIGAQLGPSAPDQFRARRPAAVRYADELMGRFLAHLEARGRLSTSLVFVTADHGEVQRSPSPVRIESFYEDVLDVPLGVHWPDALPADLAASLRANVDARVSNLDIYPTILDVWGQTEDGNRPRLGGASLARPIDGDRVLLATNTGEIRPWSRRGFALYHGDYKWVVDEKDGARVFDLDQDPGELDDRLDDVPEGERAFFLRAVRAKPPLADIMRVAAPTLLRM